MTPQLSQLGLVSPGSLIEVFDQRQQFAIEAALIRRVQSQPSGELPRPVLGRLGLMALDRTRVGVGSSGVQGGIDTAVEVERVFEVAEILLGASFGLVNHLCKTRLINLHDLQR